MTDPFPEVTFRSAEPADALCISVLATQVFLNTYALAGIRPSVAREVREFLSTEAIAALLADHNTFFILAEASERLIGFAQVTLAATHALAGPEATVELSRLYVHQSFAGKGLGTDLLRRAERFAAERGVTGLWLTAWSGNARALAFYASRGYKDVGADLYVYEDDRYETRIFVRSLD